MSLDTIMSRLRGIKKPEELALLRKAVNISAIGQREVMKAMQPGMSETEIQGLHEYIYKNLPGRIRRLPEHCLGRDTMAAFCTILITINRLSKTASSS